MSVRFHHSKASTISFASNDCSTFRPPCHQAVERCKVGASRHRATAATPSLAQRGRYLSNHVYMIHSFLLFLHHFISGYCCDYNDISRILVLSLSNSGYGTLFITTLIHTYGPRLSRPLHLPPDGPLDRLFHVLRNVRGCMRRRTLSRVEDARAHEDGRPFGCVCSCDI